MSWIPGWESIAGSGWWSGFYFWASIVALIGLGIAEIASHRYSDRKDELVAEQQRVEKQTHDQEMATVQHDTAQANERAAKLEKEAAEARAAIADANARAAVATQKANEADLARLRLETRLAPRLLNESELRAAIAKYTGIRIDLITFSQGSSTDTPILGIALEKALRAANWNVKGWTAMGGSAVITGILVVLRDGASPEIVETANALIAALRAQAIDAGRWPQLDFKTNDLKEIPVPGVNGPTWDMADVASIRILIGTKP